MYLGAHISTSGGVWLALREGRRIGCEVVQIFVKNNMQWFGKPPGPADLDRWTRELAAAKLKAVFGHTGYLINLAAPPCAKREFSLRSLLQELEIAAALRLPFLVLHPGAHLGAGEAAGLKQIIQGLDEACAATKKSAVRIALEHTAGQGSNLGYDLKHLAAIYQAVQHPKRLGLCLDTAHLFAAGYDIRTPKGWDAVLREVDELFGLKELLVVHLNDSKTGLGSRVDRHEAIGQGKIGRKGFKHIVNDPRLRHLPGCLETPKSPDLHEDIENLAVLRKLRVES